MSRNSGGTPGGIKFVMTILLCGILIVTALYFLRLDWPDSGGGSTTGGSSSASVEDGDSSDQEKPDDPPDDGSDDGSDDSSDDDSDNSSDDDSSDDSSGGGTVKPDDPPGGGDHMNGKAVLKRVGLTGKRLQNGTMVEFTDNSPVDFTNPTSENLFGIRAGETVVPGCQFTATMELCNEGNFALDYWLEVRMVSGFDTELAKQLKVTVVLNGKELTTVVGEPLGTERAPIGTIKKGEKATFTISVEFIDSADNNAAQGQTVAFDMYVTATKAS